MSDVDNPTAKRRLRGWRLFLVVCLVSVGFYGGAMVQPSYSFSLLCTYDLTYRVTATIEVDGVRYSSTAIRQLLRSREWIQQMNMAGCPQTHGTALSFRLPDDRVVLVGTRICLLATRAMTGDKKGNPTSFAAAMRGKRSVDVAQNCQAIGGEPKYKRTLPHGFIIDNADHPSLWESFRFGEKLASSDMVIRLVSATAQAQDVEPADDLDKVAPGLLDASFEYRNWAASPDTIVPFARRYKKGQKFKYKVKAASAADVPIAVPKKP